MEDRTVVLSKGYGYGGVADYNVFINYYIRVWD